MVIHCLIAYKDITMRNSVLLLSASITAASANEVAKAYIPYVWNTTAPEIHDHPVQAQNGFFYTGGNADGVCPTYEPNCASSNTTIISGPTTSPYNPNVTDAFWLGVLDPHGQEMVMIGHDFRYTLPKTNLGNGPNEKAINTPFSVEFDDFSQQTVLRFNGDDWVGCQVLDTVTGRIKPDLIVQALTFGSVLWANAFEYKCTPFKMRLEETTAPAVDYYRRDCPDKWKKCCPELCVS